MRAVPCGGGEGHDKCDTHTSRYTPKRAFRESGRERYDSGISAEGGEKSENDAVAVQVDFTCQRYAVIVNLHNSESSLQCRLCTDARLQNDRALPLADSACVNTGSRRLADVSPPLEVDCDLSHRYPSAPNLFDCMRTVQIQH
jgi:hypothetical protein